jgi:hypothetical protein
MASSSDVYVYCVLPDGTVAQRFQIDLMLQALGAMLYVVSIEWVPVELFHLAVTTPAFVKVYDVTADCISPAFCFNVRDRITSSFFAERGGRPYLTVGTLAGHVGVLPLDAAEDGPVEFSRWVGLTQTPKTCVVSYCAESSIVFISVARVSTILCHFEDLLQSTPPSLTILKSTENESVQFVCRHPTVPSLHFLKGSHDGVLILLELTDRGICVSTLPPPAKPIPRPDGSSIAFCGVFAGDESVGIVAANGFVYEIAPGETNQREFEFEQPQTHVSVPPVFWPRCHHAKNGLSVTDESGSNISLGRRIQVNRKHMALSIKSTDGHRAVVGAHITFGGAGAASIKVNGRPVQLASSGERKVALPLSRREVGGPLVADIEAAGSEIIITGMEISAVKTSDLSPLVISEPDWRFGARDLTDFSDTGDDPRGNLVDCAVVAISAAEFAPAGRTEAGSVRTLLRLMYEHPSIATACRRIVLKAAADANWLPQEWGHALAETCAAGTIAAEMREIAWRDFALLPADIRTEIEPIMWTSLGRAGLWTVVAAIVD